MFQILTFCTYHQGEVRLPHHHGNIQVNVKDESLSCVLSGTASPPQSPSRVRNRVLGNPFHIQELQAIRGQITSLVEEL